MHHLKNVLMLRMDIHPDLLSDLMELMPDLRNGFRRLRRVSDHHHIEETVDDRLRNVKDVVIPTASFPTTVIIVFCIFPP